MAGRQRRRPGSCGCGKKTYGSERAALAALERIRRAEHGERFPQRAYPCPRGKGHGWHLTSQVGDHAVDLAKGA